jgi:hypothetical protein
LAGEQSQLLTAFVLMGVFQVKHFLADFPLQTRYMLKKTKSGWDFVPPLAVHCFVHSAMTLAIVLYMKPSLWWLSLVDFVSHFIMDRVKAGPRYLGRYSDMTRTTFWVALGFDQMFHHLTHMWIVWVIVTRLST